MAMTMTLSNTPEKEIFAFKGTSDPALDQHLQHYTELPLVTRGLW